MLRPSCDAPLAGTEVTWLQHLGVPPTPSPMQWRGDYASSPNRSCGRPAGAFSQHQLLDAQHLNSSHLLQSLTMWHSESPSLAGQRWLL